MKRILLIGFLVVYLLPSTELHELLKLPSLLEHYAEHRSSKDDLSFFEFLAMHYPGDHDHDSGDDGRERHMPFKSGEGHQHLLFALYVPGEFQTELPKKGVEIPTKKFFGKINFKTLTPVKNIWQPPRQI